MKFIVFGGGGKVARHFARLAVADGHSVISVVRNEDQCVRHAMEQERSAHSSHADLKKLGAEPTVLSIEDAPVSDFTALFTSHKPDAIIWSAGAGGKGEKSRTQKVDYEGAVKVYDAMEAGNIKRLLLVGAIDVRSRDKGYPEYYNDESSTFGYSSSR